MAKRTHVFDPRQSMNRPDFEIFHYQDAKMQEVELHHHDFYEVYYFLCGRVEYLVEGRSYTLLSDDILLINPMELHRPNVAPDEAYERIVLWISREYLNAIAPEADLAHRCFATGRNLYHCAHTQIPVLIRRLAGKASDDAPGSELAARGLLLELMGELLRLTSGGERDTAGREETPLVSEILRYIGAHYAEPLTLDALAARFFVSKSNLSHLFRRSVGTSLYRYVVLKRLQHARQMLAEGMSPGEVFRSCGFHDYANFYRAFRDVYGISPNEAVSL